MQERIGVSGIREGKVKRERMRTVGEGIKKGGKKGLSAGTERCRRNKEKESKTKKDNNRWEKMKVEKKEDLSIRKKRCRKDDVKRDEDIQKKTKQGK